MAHCYWRGTTVPDAYSDDDNDNVDSDDGDDCDGGGGSGGGGDDDDSMRVWRSFEADLFACIFTFWRPNHRICVLLTVRLSGQDVERGTFSHRHALVHDQVTTRGGIYTLQSQMSLLSESLTGLLTDCFQCGCRTQTTTMCS